MFNKYLLTIYFLILIGIFVYLFKLSVPSIQSEKSLYKSEGILETRIVRLASLMTQANKEDLKKFPCDPRDTRTICPDRSKFQAQISSILEGGAVLNAALIDENGNNILTNNLIDDTFSKQIGIAKTEKISQILEKSKEGERIFNHFKTLIDMHYYVEEEEFKGLYLAATMDGGQINPNVYPNYFLIFTLFLLPIALIALKIVRTERFTEDREQEYLNKLATLEKKVERLKNENIQQSQFLANFTHELRTPLNSIIGFSGLIKDETLGSLGNEEYKKYATDINNSGVHLLSLINDILDYSKAEVGRLKVNMEECDVIKIIKQCFSIVAPRASESGVDMLQSFAKPHCILRVDKKRFKQVLLNLISNSVKFTPESGSVTVSVFNDIKQERLYIEVKDTGVGIDEKDIPTVMALFGQVETDLTRTYEGTGIGLPFAKKLTNLMGGTFEISSKVGLGTRITLGFPWDKKLNAEYQENFK